MFAGGTTWNRMEPETNWHKLKTLIGQQYCVYKIISLKNITLQITIATKSAILDVRKVSQIQLCFIYTSNKKLKQLSMKIRLVPDF